MFVFILNFIFICNAFVSFPSILNHPFCDPPSIPCMSQFPIFFFFIIKKIIAHCHISVAHVIMAVVQWIMGSLPRATTTIKKNDFPFPTTINYSDTSAFFWGLVSPSSTETGMLRGLVWCGKYSCCEVMGTVVLPCPEHTVWQYFYTVPFIFQILCPLQQIKMYSLHFSLSEEMIIQR